MSLFRKMVEEHEHNDCAASIADDEFFEDLTEDQKKAVIRLARTYLYTEEEYQVALATMDCTEEVEEWLKIGKREGRIEGRKNLASELKELLQL